MTSSISTIHLIFKTHLDIGFTDYARNVTRQYVEHFIPQAVETARALRQSGDDRFVWTTGSWLIYEYLEQAGAAERKKLEAAIVAGDIVWHALPFTTHTELLDESLFRYGLSLSQMLDKRFGKTTIAAKMTDVPGHTRGIVPLLAEAGVQFLHLGANEASTPPDLPPVFVWKDEASGTRLLVIYQKSGYGKMTIIPGLADAIAFAHTNDNIGPQTPDAARNAFDEKRQQFPGAAVVGSTMDAFAQALLTVENTLPVVTGEMGDTWIHGVGSDPLKIARFRELMRLRREWMEDGKLSPDDPVMGIISRNLLLVAEHTWGLDEKTWLKDYDHYRAKDFKKARKTQTFQDFEASWKEQRGYIDAAVAALGDSPLSYEAKNRLNALNPRKPTQSDYQPITSPIETRRFEIGFDPHTGAMTHLRDKVSKRIWADEDHPLGLFRYETFGAADYERFYRQYIINKRATRHWSIDDYTKPGLKAVGNTHHWWQPTLANISLWEHKDETNILLELNGPEPAIKEFGCPAQIFIRLIVHQSAPVIEYDLSWFDKAACRIPEALWFSFIPRVRPGGSWLMEKLGQWIRPTEVLKNGNRKLHAVQSGVQYTDAAGSLGIDTLDAPLVAPGQPSLLDFNNRQPEVRGGMHVNLYNNVWGTNFSMWSEDDRRFRFVLNTGSGQLDDLKSRFYHFTDSTARRQAKMRKLTTFPRAETLTGLEKLLNSGDSFAFRWAAYAVLRLDSAAGSAMLLPFFDSADAEVRYHLSGLAGDYGDAQLVEPLIRVLQTDSVPENRHLAAFSLGKLGDKRAIPALEHARLHDKGEDFEGRTVASAATEALERITGGADSNHA